MGVCFTSVVFLLQLHLWIPHSLYKLLIYFKSVILSIIRLCICIHFWGLSMSFRHSQSFQIYQIPKALVSNFSQICIWVALWHFGLFLIIILIYGMILVCWSVVDLSVFPSRNEIVQSRIYSRPFCDRTLSAGRESPIADQNRYFTTTLLLA